jgi:type II secretory pathway pseudopilin PulG
MDTPATWATRQVIGLILLAVVIIALVAIGYRWKSAQDKHAADAATISQQGQTAQATDAITKDLGTTQAEAQRVEVTVRTDTAALARNLERLRHENPSLDSRLAEPWPAELRELARQRRLARDRPGVAAPGGRPADPRAPAPGSGDAR